MKSRKLIKFLLCFMAGAILITFLTLLNRHHNRFKNAGHLPQMEIETVHGTPFNIQSLNNVQKPLLINFFHPECGFCLMEAQEILDNQSELSDIQMVFITFANNTILEPFLSEYPLDTIANVIIAYDTDLQFTSYFNVKAPPVSFIYDRRVNLVKVLEGYKSFKLIKDVLKKAKS